MYRETLYICTGEKLYECLMRAPRVCAILDAAKPGSVSVLAGGSSTKGRLLMGGDTPTRILLADNDPRVRSALHTLLRQEPGQIVIRESADLRSLAVQVREFRPDLVLLEWELPGRPAAALLLALHGVEYHPKVIVLSKRPESEQDALVAGADAFVSKSDPPDRLLKTFRRLVQESRKEVAD